MQNQVGLSSNLREVAPKVRHLYWLYNSAVDAEFYSDWYGPSVTITPFPYAGAFYPTDDIRDMGVEISSWDADGQAHFRSSMDNFASSLAQAISLAVGPGFTFEANDIVIDHYVNLQNQAIVVEGFVDRGDLHLAFKALLNIADPSQTMVFVPTSQEPTPADLATLKAMNDRIVQLGGDPYTADVEPE